jgi:hypothetical protein
MSIEPDLPESPACPLLGLAADPATHFTFAQRDHRCHAKDRPKAIPAELQTGCCLAVEFASCDRYRAWLGSSPKPAGSWMASPTSATSGIVQPPIGAPAGGGWPAGRSGDGPDVEPMIRSKASPERSAAPQAPHPWGRESEVPWISAA